MGEIRHHELEPVLGLGFEMGGRMVSGGGDVVKVWEQAPTSDTQNANLNGITNGGGELDDSEDDDDDDEEESSEEEEKQKKRKKRRKRNKSKGKTTGNGIMGFKGLE